MLKISLKKYQSVYIIELAGELDVNNVRELLDAFEKLLENRVDHFVIDLTALEYLDSSGIGTLVQIKNRLIKSETPKRLQIAGLQGAALKIVQLAKLYDFFPHSESLKDALLKIQKEPHDSTGAA